MQVRDVMTEGAVSIAPEAPVSVAARTLSRNNLGSLPVCGSDGKVRGVLTDRDIVLRSVAANEDAGQQQVREIMTRRVVTVAPEDPLSMAAQLMAREQVRRLPVLENGRLCGMVSLGDLAGRAETSPEAGDALTEISDNLSRRG